ncbi:MULTISPECIES: Bax inhibitor-1/YccA family protein [unclassified Paenibacillus]|uniref:Bax inhibitor-1/YccA family protein n=1 Tax=unclassified Paenibacillus TaxID=185978 RepID=UPI0036356803
MSYDRSGNPVLQENTFKRASEFGADTMTIGGTVNKAFISLAILLGSAFYVWNLHFQSQNVQPFLITGIIGALLLSLLISFIPRISPVAVPVYALLEGLALGSISAIYEAKYHGIALQAVMITLGVFVGLLVAYKLHIIRATETFKRVIIISTIGIMVVYLVSWLLGFFGVRMPYLHDNGIIGIGISLFIVIIAALNLILDFDFIERGSQNRAPKYMEWYGAFGLLITVVWLYIEVLRLLSKLRK